MFALTKIPNVNSDGDLTDDNEITSPWVHAIQCRAVGLRIASSNGPVDADPTGIRHPITTYVELNINYTV